MNRDLYNVRTRRWNHGWELAISGPDYFYNVVRTDTRESAAELARDHISRARDVPADSFDVMIIPMRTSFLGDLIKDVRTMAHRAVNR